MKKHKVGQWTGGGVGRETEILHDMVKKGLCDRWHLSRNCRKQHGPRKKAGGRSPQARAEQRLSEAIRQAAGLEITLSDTCHACICFLATGKYQTTVRYHARPPGILTWARKKVWEIEKNCKTIQSNVSYITEKKTCIYFLKRLSTPFNLVY